MVTTFSAILDDLCTNVKENRDTLLTIAKKNPHMAYQKVSELAVFVGSRHGVNLQIHFPSPTRITQVDLYGTENIGMVVDKWRKTFPIPREDVKKKAEQMLPGAKAQDAYMYEGKEGVRILTEGGRLEVLPGSIHLWCVIDNNVRRYVDWLMENVYFNQSSS